MQHVLLQYISDSLLLDRCKFY